MDRATKARQAVDEYIRRRGMGDGSGEQQFLDAHRDLLPELEEQLRTLQLIDRARSRAEEAAEDGSGADLASSTSGAHPLQASKAQEPPPDYFPGYEITSRIHHGGQGVVYRATQNATGRSVAIKVMREGPFASPHDRVRFDREVRILATLNHPHIVTIHDSGTADGHFHYVMDYIDGEALDVYLSHNVQSVEDELRLFVKICDAVNDAHLRGIIHRDLKPSNIRIDRQGEPHVLDFGLAKIETGGDSDDPAPLPVTVTGQFVGSLPWSSPEQAEGSSADIDIRTDVYSLGVVLYQMLTNCFPYEVAGQVREVMDNVVNAEPVRPSSIRPQINDEVETIVLKCLAKERERRYQSAGDLARDVRRYLAGEPIEAKRTSTWYVFRKSVRRHKTVTLAVTAFLVLSIGFGVAMSVMYGGMTRRADQNRRLASCLQGLLRFNVRDGRRAEALIRTHLDTHADSIAGELADLPEMQVELMQTVANAYASVGAHDRSASWIRRVYELERDVLGRDERVLAKRQCELGRLLDRAGGHSEEAALHLRQSVARLRAIAEGPDQDLIGALGAYSSFLGYSQRDFDAGITLRAEGLDMTRALYPDDHSSLSGALCSMAKLLHDKGDHAAAEPYYLDSIAMANRLDPSDPVWNRKMWLGLLYKDMGRYEAAERLIREALAGISADLGETSVSAANALHHLARLQTDSGQLEAAEETCRKTLDLFVASYGADHRDTAIVRTLLGRILVGRKRFDEAEPLLRSALEVARVRMPQHWETAKMQSLLGASLAGLGRFEEAEPLLLSSYPVIRDGRGREHRRTCEAIQRIVNLYDTWGKPDQAAAWRAKLPAVAAQH